MGALWTNGVAFRCFGDESDDRATLNQPHGLCAGGRSFSRFVYVCDTGNNRIAVFATPSGAYFRSFTTTSMEAPTAITYMEDMKLFCVAATKVVVLFNAEETCVGFFANTVEVGFEPFVVYGITHTPRNTLLVTCGKFVREFDVQHERISSSCQGILCEGRDKPYLFSGMQTGIVCNWGILYACDMGSDKIYMFNRILNESSVRV